MPDVILPNNGPSMQGTNAVVPLESGSNSNNVPRDPRLQEEWDEFRLKINGLRSVWNIEESETERRRQLRMMKIQLDLKREKGEIAMDDIYIPVRVIHDNISKEAPQYAAYLTTSRNSAVFKPKKKLVDPLTGAELPTEKLEQGFTKLCRYPGWEIPHFKCNDGSQMHGWDWIEVTFDETKPGHFACEHVMHERLWFPEDTENAQDCEIFVRVYRLSKKKMLSMFPDEASKEQINKIFYDRGDGSKMVNYSLGILYKVYYRREDGIVYTCWLNPERCDWFIREPMPLFRGRRHIVKDTFSGIVVSAEPIFETRYPLHPLPYMVTEDNRLLKTKGRGFLDEYVQEAAGSLISSIVNAYHRAITPMASVDGDPGIGGKLAQLDIKMERDKIYNKKLDFWAPPYPDAAGLEMVNALLTQNKQEAGQTSFATLNRDQPGDRKTAREISASQQQQQMLSTVQVALYSVFLKDVYTDCWLIAKSRLEQGVLPDCDIDPAYLTTDYDVYAAGDTEVVQRDETVQKLMQVWPIISQTPAAMEMLKDLLNLVFPSRAQDYIKALTQGDPTKQVLAGVTQLLTAMVTSHPNLVPDDKIEQFGQLIAAGKQLSGQTPQNANPTNNNNPTNNGAPANQPVGASNQ